MASLGYCKISDLKISANSKRAIGEVRDLIDHGILLSGAIAATPLYNIFMTPSVTGGAAETMVTIREYDWELFGNALSATSKVTKNRILNVAEPMTWQTSGKEQSFWRCVSEAAL
ncbi:hypothetical protein [Vibrio cionasavignyae]|uniref:hypothetical protein n=1 Tax=Vibrio cionasavignyae TaxID=2910252 RepID=UPI003D0EDF3E